MAPSAKQYMLGSTAIILSVLLSIASYMRFKPVPLDYTLMVQNFHNLDKKEYGLETMPQVLLPEFNLPVNCSAIFRNSSKHIDEAFAFQKKHPRKFLDEQYYIKLTENCTNFRLTRRYIMQPLSYEEAQFPLAFGFMVYKDIEYFERLLRAIYQPQNAYCVHVDLKSPSFYQYAVRRIASCLPNVFLSSYQRNVKWCGFTNIEPVVLCMRELLERPWKYYFTLTGQEFPLKTNRQLVRIAKAFNGANDIMGFHHPTAVAHAVTRAKRQNQTIFERKLPFNYTLVKGEAHLMASRGYVDYLVNNDTAKAFLQWIKDGLNICADEVFFPSLANSPQMGVPGSYKGKIGTVGGSELLKPSFVRYKLWQPGIFYEGKRPSSWQRYTPSGLTCGASYRRWICPGNLRDLHRLYEPAQYFINKFLQHVDPLAYDCLEWLHFQKLQNEVNGIFEFSTLEYEKSSVVRDALR